MWMTEQMWEADSLPNQVLREVQKEHDFVASHLLQAVQQRSPKEALLTDNPPGKNKKKGYYLGRRGPMSEITVGDGFVKPFGKNETQHLEDCTIVILRLRGAYQEGCDNATQLDAQFAARGLRRAYVLIGEEERGCAPLTPLAGSPPRRGPTPTPSAKGLLLPGRRAILA